MLKLLSLCSLLTLTVGLAGNIAAQKGRKHAAPCANARTQLELNDCAEREFQKADAELNQVYQQLITAHQADKLFVEKLRAAQRAWLAFRDAQLESLYSAADPRAEYRSVFPMCYSMAKTELTVARAKQLQHMLNGSPEGEVCQ